MRTRHRIRLGIGLAAVALAIAGAAASAAACVVGTGSAASCTDAALNACLSPAPGYDGTVTFNCGGPATIDISPPGGTGTKTISADTTIDGGGQVTISGGNAVRVFRVTSGITFTVRNLTIANGYDNAAAGGGIFNDHGTVHVANSTFSGNNAAAGGGIDNYGGTVHVTTSTFSGNSTDGLGGGIYSWGTLTVTTSTFAGNSAVGSGGGGSGGGIFNDGTLTVANSTFSANSAGYGGGINNSTFDTATVTNSTFSGNSANTKGGGIFNNLGKVLVTNTIIARSLGGGNCAGSSFNDGGHNLEDTDTCGFKGSQCATAGGTSFCNTDPGLAAGLADNGGPTQTIALLVGSRAIDSADPSVCAAPPVNGLDQRASPRDRLCDIGAFEVPKPTAPAASAVGLLGLVVLLGAAGVRSLRRRASR